MAAESQTSCENVHGKISVYNPPEWALNLKSIPKSRAKWTPPHVPDGFEVYIKREDLTGSTLSGNKVRKLEFLLADALEKGCDTVITFGGPQSNHARATAVAARELGLEPYVFMLDFLDTVKGSTEHGCHGNTLLMRLVGTNIVVYPLQENVSLGDQIDHIEGEMEKFADKLSSEGHKAYIIPKGGSNTLGAWGYIDGFYEMMQQGLLEDFDDVFVAAGSGGTVCGLAVANYLTGSKLRIHGVSLYATDAKYLFSHLEECLKDLGLSHVRPEELVNPVLEYIGMGYAHSTKEELDSIAEVMSHTGITLDPDFTVKTYRGMIGEMKKSPSMLKGRRILCIHTGGVYVLFDGRIDNTVQQQPECSRVTKSSDLFS